MAPRDTIAGLSILAIILILVFVCVLPFRCRLSTASDGGSSLSTTSSESSGSAGEGDVDWNLPEWTTAAHVGSTYMDGNPMPPLHRAYYGNGRAPEKDGC
jgi:hypothetical protein